MPSLTEYFRSEARDLLETLERTVAGGRPDAAALHRTARGLRGSAQIAREERFFRAVLAFENVTRSAAAGVLAWSEDMTERVLSTVTDLRALLEPHADAAELEARAAAVASRWQRGSPVAPPAPAAPSQDAREFRQFAGREAAAIADTIEQGIAALQANPMDREPLRAVLRRQRALLGAARLEEIPVVAEILRAIEDLTRVVAKLDVGVKQEWLDIYRVARDGLHAAVAALVRGDEPQPSHAFSRLRHMRTELLERYGEGEAVSAAHETPGLVQATAMDAAAAATIKGAARHGAIPDTPHRPQEGERDASPFADAALELSEAAVVEEDGVLELNDSAVIDDDAVLELNDGAVIDDDAMLELNDDAIVRDAAVIELDDDAVVDADAVLASNAVIMDAAVLQLDEVASEPAAAVLQLEEGDVYEGPTATSDPLQRARELRDIVARAAAHDPRARAALDELMTILRDAFE